MAQSRDGTICRIDTIGKCPHDEIVKGIGQIGTFPKQALETAASKRE
jgi:hypothetical protein